MTYKENITAILECHFGGFKQELIDSACNCILELEPCEYAPFTIAELKDEDTKKLFRKFKNQRVAGNLTNGDMIKAMFPNAQIDYHEKSDLVDDYVTVFIKDCDTCQDYSYDWWNAPYEGGEDIMSKETTCENCIYANECIMYEPTMKRCKDYKESEDKE